MTPKHLTFGNDRSSTNPDGTRISNPADFGHGTAVEDNAARNFDSAIALVMVIAGLLLMASCSAESSRLGRIASGPTGVVYFNSSALPDTRTGPVRRFEAQYAGKTFRGSLLRSGSSLYAKLGNVPMGTVSGLEFRILAGNQMVYQAFQSNVLFNSSNKNVRIADCNVKQGWSGTLHQDSCRWTIR